MCFFTRRTRGQFIFLLDRVDGTSHKSAEVRIWGGGKMSIQDREANKTPSFTQDHGPLGNKITSAGRQGGSHFNHIHSLKTNVFIYLFNGINTILFSFAP